jgi:hypothetical protein
MALINAFRMNGLGNDFIIVDRRKNSINITKEKIIELGKRISFHRNIGFDQIIFIEEGGKDFGIGAEVISRLAEELGPELVLSARIAALPVPIPSARQTEEYVLPNTNIAHEINKILKK